MIIDFLPVNLVQRLAFCLVHSIWQTSLVAMSTVSAARLVSRRRPEWRYPTLVAGMVLIPITAIATFLSFNETQPLVARIVDVASATSVSPGQFAQWMQWAVLFWMTGVAISSIQLSVSWMLSRRLLQLADVLAPPEIVESFEALRRRLGVTKPVRLVLSKLVDVPVVIGWLRPAVLLPISALSGLDPDQLRAVLAHELAHIRRHDFAINLLQRCVESLMFYHPAVWWLSSRTRAEREHCCDDLAVGVCGDRLAYAKALVALEQSRSDASFLAVAANGGSLSFRIRRILGRETTYPDRLSAGVAGIFIGVWLFAGLWQSNALMATQPPIPEFAPLPFPAEAPAMPLPIPSMIPSPSLAQITLMALAGGQSIDQQSGTIAGNVVKMGTGEPLSGTRVGLVTVDGKTTPFKTITTIDGKFTLTGIPVGAYRLLAARNDGLLPVEYGQKAPNTPGMPINVNAGQAITEMQLAMLPTGAISGRVLDQDGQPLGHARVQALRPVYSGTERALNIVESVETNDLGEYRLFWLAPGSYYVSAAREAPGTNRLQVYIQAPDDTRGHSESRPPLIRHEIQPNGEAMDAVELPSYYPNVDDTRGASAIQIHPADNIRGIDVRLAEPRPSRRISGKVTDGATGLPFGGGRVQAVREDAGPFRTGGPLSPSSTAYSTPLDGNGNFVFDGIVPGSYTLIVAGPQPLAVERHAHVRVDVGDKDPQNVSITVPASFPVGGRVIVDGPSNLDISTLRVSITNVLTNITPTPLAPAPDGSFTFAQLGPGDYIPEMRLPASNTATTGMRLSSTFYLKSIRMGNIDVIRDGLHLDGPPQAPIEMIIGTNPGTVSGTLRNARGEIVTQGVLALLPTEKTISPTEFSRITASNASGQFALKGLRPGNYRLFAWEQVENGSWYDDNYMQGLQDRAIAVHVGEGGKVTLDITAIAPKN